MARRRRHHRPIEVIIDGRRECSPCGVEVIGFGASLRHTDESVPVVVPDPEDARVMARAREVAHSVALRMPGAPEHEIVQAVADAFYTEGLLRRRPGERRGNVILDEPQPRDPDHAERAAGVRVPA